MPKIPTSSTTAKRRKIKLPAHSRLNKTIVHELDSLLDFVSPQELSKHLRRVFMVYVHHEHELLPNDFAKMTDNFYFLFEFLDKAAEEMEK
jgi:hypothetical protein